MGEIIEEIIDDFTEGISDDPRRTDLGLSQLVSNFDIFTNHKRLIPTVDTEDGDSGSSTSQKQIFDIGLWTPGGGSWRLFGLGVVSGTGRAEINMKTLTVGGSDDLSDAAWLSPSNNASSGGATDFRLFVYYKTTGKFYGASGGSAIWAFTPDGSTAFDDASHSLTYKTLAQGLVHSKDDNLYIPYDNKIARNNAGSWTDAAITLPSSFYITSICEFGNYLAIAAAPLSGVGKSRVYLWDRDASLATLSESIDWGEGILMVIEELEGALLGISIAGNSQTRTRSRIIFKKSDGTNTAQKFLELLAPLSTVTNLLQTKQKANSRIYFMMNITIDGIMREGVWALGVASNGQYGIALERVPDNKVSVVGLGGVLRNFIVVGDFIFIAFVDSNSTYALRHTNDQQVYTTNCTYESVIKNAGDSSKTKKLVGISSMFEPLPSGALVRNYYKKDSEATFRKVFEYAVQNAISKDAVRLINDTNAFTVTIASPGVFTLANHGLVVGQRIRLKTTGTLPTGLAINTDYYVISAGFTDSTFELSATSGGTAINTSVSQSGVHTIDRVSENLKDGKEFKYRIESTGGAVITAFKSRVEMLDKNPY